MRKFMLYSFHKCTYIGSHLGYETREEAEHVAQNLSTKTEFWYTEIGIYQLVSKAKFAPQGEITSVDEAGAESAA